VVPPVLEELAVQMEEAAGVLHLLLLQLQVHPRQVLVPVLVLLQVQQVEQVQRLVPVQLRDLRELLTVVEVLVV